jgi:hypothetical protein
LISTALPQRDGTRDTGGEPGGGGGEQGIGISDGLSYVDPRFQGEGANEPLTPGRVATGTNDSSFSFNKIEYIGSFLMGGLYGDRSDSEFCNVAFMPPNGSNGSFGSLFCGYNRFNLQIFEYQIPETLSSSPNVFDLPRATELQGAFSIIDAAKSNRALSPGMNVMGWMQVINGKLYANTLDSYTDAGTETPYKLVVIETPSNMQSSVVSGAFNITPYDGGVSDMFSTYCFPIPLSKQTEFNGNTHMIGNFMRASITGRLSQGPSVRGIKPGDWNFSLDDQAVGDTYALYGSGDLARYESRNAPVKTYYDNLIGLDFNSWVMVPTGATGAQSDSDRVKTVTLTMQAGPQSSNQGVCSADFGVYTNSIVVKNSDDTVTYSEGTDYTVEVSDRTLSGYGQTRLFGRTVILKTSGGSISDGQTLNVTYSYLSKRFNDLTYYPNPAKSVPFDAGTEITGASGAVFIPNTKTIMFLGYMRGGRYGIQYKGGDLQVLEVPSGGTTTRDFRDSDDYYWLMNTDDIASASTVNNVPLYQYGIFDENRWYDKGSTWQSLQSGEDRGGTLTSCTYDPATKRLYVIHRGIQESSQVGTSRRSQIVSVYLLNF